MWHAKVANLAKFLTFNLSLNFTLNLMKKGEVGSN